RTASHAVVRRRCRNSSPKKAAGGRAGQCGGLGRATRPPSWSISTGASARPTDWRSPATRERTWSGFSTLRANRMKPSGSAARKKSRSSAVSEVPAQPKMMEAVIAAAARSKPHRQALLLLRFQLFAYLLGLRRIGQRAGLDAVVDSLGAEVGPLHGQLQGTESIGELLLQLGPLRLGEIDRLHRPELDAVALGWLGSRRGVGRCR